MAEKHPDELALLAYVEDDGSAEERAAVADHLGACAACAESVRLLEAGRAALRAAPLLELPDERREAILAALPERRDPWRIFRPARRSLVVAAPVAAAAALVLVFVLAGVPGGGGDREESAAVAEEGGGQDAELEQAQEDAAGAAPSSAPEGTLLRSVEGPAREVVRLLEEAGIPAEVVGGRVVATGAERDVRAALEGRPAGGVDVYVR
jgi:anti-sigma factor RsiW